MIRLVLLFSPATAIAAGIVMEQAWNWSLHRAFMDEAPLQRALGQRQERVRNLVSNHNTFDHTGRPVPTIGNH